MICIRFVSWIEGSKVSTSNSSNLSMKLAARTWRQPSNERCAKGDCCGGRASTASVRGDHVFSLEKFVNAYSAYRAFRDRCPRAIRTTLGTRFQPSENDVHQLGDRELMKSLGFAPGTAQRLTSRPADSNSPGPDTLRNWVQALCSTLEQLRC